MAMNSKEALERLEEIEKRININSKTLNDFLISVLPEQSENIWNNNVDLRKEANKIGEMFKDGCMSYLNRKYQGDAIQCGDGYGYLCPKCQKIKEIVERINGK